MRFLVLASALLLLQCTSSSPGTAPATPSSQTASPKPAKPAKPAPPTPTQSEKSCTSTADCPSGQRCSTDDGDCRKPPGCGPNDICPAVCTGVCKEGAANVKSACKADADCRAYSSYCDGCTCLPLPKDAPAPQCKGSKVSCIADPCMTKAAACVQGQCTLKERAVK